MAVPEVVPLAMVTVVVDKVGTAELPETARTATVITKSRLTAEVVERVKVELVLVRGAVLDKAADTVYTVGAAVVAATVVVAVVPVVVVPVVPVVVVAVVVVVAEEDDVEVSAEAKAINPHKSKAIIDERISKGEKIRRIE
jgi:uncharacterized membrane protein